MADKQFTKDVLLSQLTRTSVKAKNDPSHSHEQRLLFLAYYLIQPVINRFGPCDITSAYRSPEVNRAIGGSETSQHSDAEAADFVPRLADIRDVFHWCRTTLSFGQLIFEKKNGKTWLHISLPRLGKPNMQVLVYNGETYQPYKEGLV